MNNELLICPWCGEKMRFDADSVHVWYKCDNCLAISPKANRLWDNSKSNKENWDENKNRALSLIDRFNVNPYRWISVEERLPERGITKCSACVKCGDGLKRVVCASYNAELKLWTGWHGEKIGNEITHWMPLPEPPKEE